MEYNKIKTEQMKNKEEIKILVSEKRYNELLEFEKLVKKNIVLVADNTDFSGSFTYMSESEAIENISEINKSNAMELYEKNKELFIEHGINGVMDIELKNLRSGNVFNFLRWKYGTEAYDASADRERRLGYINNMDSTNSITFSGNDNK